MKFTDNQIIAAMKGTGGIYLQIMKNLENLSKPPGQTIARNSLRERIEKNPVLLEAYKAEQEVIDDMAETGIAKAIQQNQQWAFKLWAQYKGRLRGYRTASDTDITSNGQTVTFSNNVPRPDKGK